MLSLGAKDFRLFAYQHLIVALAFFGYREKEAHILEASLEGGTELAIHVFGKHQYVWCNLANYVDNAHWNILRQHTVIQIPGGNSHGHVSQSC